MWDVIKNLVTEVKGALGIEIPELPVDLASAGDAAATAGQGLTESATGAFDGVAAAGEAAAGQFAGATEMVSGIPAAALESVTPAVPDQTDVLTGGSAPK
jgi:hypothetical protein